MEILPSVGVIIAVVVVVLSTISHIKRRSQPPEPLLVPKEGGGKKFRWMKKRILVFLGLVGAVIIFRAAYTGSRKPETQVSFEAIVGKWRTAYTDAKNDFLREPMRKQRGAELCKRVPFQVTDWYGTVAHIGQ